MISGVPAVRVCHAAGVLPRRVGARPPHLIGRARLTAVLDAVPPGGTALLAAPAGWGKSVLTAEWLGGRSACWLSLTSAHDDAVVLAGDLVAALRRSEKVTDPVIADLAQRGGTCLGPQFLDAFVAELDIGVAPLVLVLDDADLVTNEGVLADLGRLLARLPDRCRAVVATRRDLPTGVGRLRVEGRLVELRSADLACDLSEAAALLRRTADRPVSEGQAKLLLERTEGWAAGLQLAALSMRRTADLDRFVDGFAGDDRLVADYLTEEVLRSVGPGTRWFLLRTSILETMSPALCDAVTGRDDAQATLRRLVDRGLFTTEEQRSSGLFHYHHLFADLLRSELRSEGPEAERDCRRAAARWLLAHGHHRAGVDQLLAAGEHEAAFDVLDTEGHRLFERGETATLARGLATIHDGDPSPSPRVAISLLASHVGADQFTAAAETYRRLTRRTDLTAGERIAVDTLASHLGHGDLAMSEMKRLATGVLRTLPGVDRGTVIDFLGMGGADSCETMAGFAAGLADLMLGDVAASAARFERVLEQRGASYPLWRVNTLGALALARAWLGLTAEAEECAGGALYAARDVDGMDQVACVPAHLARATVSLDRMDLGEAGSHLSAAAAIVDRCHRPFYRHLVQLVRVRHAAAVAGARPALDLLRRSPWQAPVRPVVTTARTALEIQLLVRTDAIGEARVVLDGAEGPTPASHFDVLLAEGDLDAAGQVLASWRPEDGDRRGELEHALRAAAFEDRQGHPGAAGRSVADTAVAAEAGGILAPFFEAPVILHILRSATPSRPLHRLRALARAVVTEGSRTEANAGLLDPLTPREIAVLEYLPTRLSNREIADALVISVNTLKTHVRSIYRKLGVEDRDEGVDRASAIGLI